MYINGFLGIFEDSSHKLSIFKLLIILLVIVGLFVIGLDIVQLGFWRHDAWGYTWSEVNEFKYNGRWAAPIAHYFFRYLPHEMTWFFSVIMMWGYLYIFVRRFLGSASSGFHLIAFILPFSIIFQPGFLGQLFWPTHSFAAILPLFIASLFTLRKSSYLACFLGAFFSFSVLQTFAFISLFLAIPNKEVLLGEGAKRKMVYIWMVWVFSISFSAFFSKAVQYVCFGEIPALPSWRRPNPAGSLSELWVNLTDHWIRFLDQFSSVFNSFMVFSVFLVFLVCGFLCLYKKNSVRRFWLLLFLFFSATALSVSVHLATAYDGVFVSNRTTFLFGAGLILAFLAIFMVLDLRLRHRSIWFHFGIVLFLFAMMNPYFISLYNVSWFSNFSKDLVKSIDHIEEASPRYIGSVIIDIRKLSESSIWPLDYDDVLHGNGLFIEGLDHPERIARAFYEKGYESLIWCDGVMDDSKCNPVATPDYNSCSFDNPRFCSAGLISHDWYVKF